MAACPSCGRENADDARFCSACGTELAAEHAREQRKVVTVLFCDLVGSTALGELTDPEALRARMRRYFEDLRVILERHGGTVEKFVGDAVMAVFGIPVSHEDDALRAVRAAEEMRAAIAEHGLEARIGVNTGEVVVGGEGETLVTGDAVNVAARLEQAGAAGQVLIGDETRLLVRDAVRVERVEPLTLKGKAEPVEAYSLLEVIGDASPLARHLDTPLVGRERERQRLWRDYEDAVADRTCRLFTLLGPAGIGKSRLVADFLERVGGSADVLRGRCLSYGEGITYWPLVEILIAIGAEPDSVIGTSPPETQLAFRRLLEDRAAERPQVVLVDDLQWAEPVFIDLVEHVADFTRDAPVFLLCVARTELLDVRPDWGGGKLNATSLLLEPLNADQCGELMDRLVPDVLLDSELRDRIAVASAGNPLYVEEMLAMVREHGDGEVVVPPTIQALLQARIDSLDRDVRVVMERGAVEGEVFHRGAVAELSPDPVREVVGSHLATLVRKELIRSTSPTFPEDEGFRFRHLLIRDAAYESLPKAIRAELHERFADWLAAHDLVERDEIVGYHLEQAHRYRAELDPGDPALAALSRRASAHLADAGGGALDRGDFNAGLSLLRRASDLLGADEEERHVLAPDLVIALWESGELERARAVAHAAYGAKDPVVAALATIPGTVIDLVSGVGATREERLERVERAHEVLGAAGHELGLGLYWWYRAGEEWLQLHAAATAEACERGLAHFERSGSFARSEDLLGWIRAAYVYGPTPVPDAIERMETLLATAGGRLLDTAGASGNLARLLSMRGEFERARALYVEATETYHAVGMTVSTAGYAMYGAWIEQRAGDVDAWEEELRTGLRQLEPFPEERAFRATLEAYLAHCLYQQGRLQESQDFSRRARASSPPADLVNFLYADAVDAALASRRDADEEALTLIGRAFAFVETTDFVAGRAEVRLLYAEIEQLAGRTEEATTLAAQALVLLEEKGDVTLAARARERLAALRIGTS